MTDTTKGTIRALLSALTYGASIPFSKLLLEGTTSLQLSSLLYLGAGIGTALILLSNRARPKSEHDTPLSTRDIPAILLMLAVNTASIIALMYGIQLSAAENASLLVNFEIVATALLAFVLFRENIDRRFALSMALICLSTILLSWEGAGSLSFSPGSLLIVAACALWGLENCCTKSLSDKDPVQTTCIKCLGTGVAAAVISLVFDGAPAIAPLFLVGSLAVGVISYGLSIVLYIKAQRTLGAARTGNYYAVAPFIGVFLSWVLFGVSLNGQFFIAFALMVAGTALSLSEKHEHEHVHEAIEHDHMHTHTDDHHTHTHPGRDPELPHAHMHTHEAQRHTHAHTPDIHHSHSH